MSGKAPELRFLESFPPAQAEDFAMMWQNVCSIVNAGHSAASVGKVRELLWGWFVPRFESTEKDYRDANDSKVSFLKLSPEFRKGAVEELLACFEPARARQFALHEVLGHWYQEPIADWASAEVILTADRLLVDGYQVMDTWETPIMHEMVVRALAERRSTGHPKVLEVGWGMGISGRRFLEMGVDYTVIEAHPTLVVNANKLIQAMSANGKVVNSLWQDAAVDDDTFDVIFFDAYEATADHHHQNYLATVAKHFFPKLKRGGTFTYFITNNIGQIGGLLDAGFEAVVCSNIGGFVVPDDCTYSQPGPGVWLNIIARK